MKNSISVRVKGSTSVDFLADILMDRDDYVKYVAIADSNLSERKKQEEINYILERYDISDNWDIENFLSYEDIEIEE
ncbi:hypothetical protein [Xenorhabdus bovienii]|uniref:hypothetical protein n=1 Tax=Xenorhabdus bovienii TaxID=40576 RepID=UPI0004D62B0E|nr:hypothetical protein [Xenorhabdus bovienii]CDG88114.1 conserved hypothetical protein [Xenorhabdus bovienii str. feltiae France]CDG91813.1 conserved hypothetical protein [Xenorhabdus bovienii str. feltiae Florida]